MELALLLWAKAVSSDTYATWVLHLWGILSDQNALPSLTPLEGEKQQSGLWTGCGRNFVGPDHSQPKSNTSTASVSSVEMLSTQDDADELVMQQPPEAPTKGFPAPVAAQAEQPTVQHECHPLLCDSSELLSTDERSSTSTTAPPLISIGLQRDPNILSEKNLLLVAHKVPAKNRWTSDGKTARHITLN